LNTQQENRRVKDEKKSMEKIAHLFSQCNIAADLRFYHFSSFLLFCSNLSLGSKVFVVAQDNLGKSKGREAVAVTVN